LSSDLGNLTLAEISHAAKCHNHRSNHFFQGILKHPTYTTIKPDFGWLWTVTVAGFNALLLLSVSSLVLHAPSKS
jgi:hypothetical protein